MSSFADAIDLYISPAVIAGMGINGGSDFIADC
jgi:hypothetical protein